MNNRTTLRNTLRAKRQSVNVHEQILASQKITTHITNLPVFQQSTHIAAYMAQQNEIDPTELIKLAWQINKFIYLPVLQAQKQLAFVRYTINDHLITNRYQILEPELITEKTLPAAQLDLVLMPLVAFDRQGHRLGMGSGYYDKTFSFLQTVKRPHKPFLLGLAYQWQLCDSISVEAWDIGLDAIVTDENIYSCAN